MTILDLNVSEENPESDFRILRRVSSLDRYWVWDTKEGSIYYRSLMDARRDRNRLKACPKPYVEMEAKRKKAFG